LIKLSHRYALQWSAQDGLRDEVQVLPLRCTGVGKCHIGTCPPELGWSLLVGASTRNVARKLHCLPVSALWPTWARGT